MALSIQDIKAATDKLVADVAAQDTVEDSIVTLLETVVAQNKDLAQQLADAVAGNDPAAIQAVLDSMNATTADIEAKTQKLADAVTANTPQG